MRSRRIVSTAVATVLAVGGVGVGVAAAAGSAPAPSEIRFAPGATAGTVTGRLAAAGTAAYVFDARQGQTAVVDLVRSSPTTRWTLVAPDGEPLHSQMGEAVDATTTLPLTGTYRLDVLTTSAGTYSLSLAIPATFSGTRLRFVPGSSSGVADGTLPAGGSRTYVFGASAGQRADVTFDSTSSAAGWTLYAPDGRLLRLPGAQPSGGDYPLPLTGDYALVVSSPQSTSYRVHLGLPVA